MPSPLTDSMCCCCISSCISLSLPLALALSPTVSQSVKSVCQCVFLTASDEDLVLFGLQAEDGEYFCPVYREIKRIFTDVDSLCVSVCVCVLLRSDSWF